MALPLPSWSTSAALLPSLLLLETVLSADNALALAAQLRPVRSEVERRQLLNWGLAMAIVLRGLAVAAAGILLHQPLLRLLGGAYLIWLALGHFRDELGGDVAMASGREDAPESGEHGSPGSRIARVVLLAATNLAFSLDSLCAALALTSDLALVMLAGTIGVIVLRGVTGLVLGWMERFPNLANAAYLTVLAVGLRLVVEQLAPFLVPPEAVLLGAMAVLLAWGLTPPQPARP